MASASGSVSWGVALINQGKYLTTEKFQFKVNVNGTSLKMKQTWTLESAGGECMALKSCYGRYLASDKDGKITADSETIGDDNKLILETQEDGKVAFKTAHGRYFGGSADNMTGFNKEVGPTNLWTIKLTMMPQINLRNVNRKTYAHLDSEKDEIRCNEIIPWGSDATISIEFHDGKYCIRAFSGLYLNRTGVLDQDLNTDCLYVIVFRGAQVAFRDCQGKYLTAVGANAILQARKLTIGKDELFTIEDVNPQVTFIAYNRKYISSRTGKEEVRANQSEVTDDETFQLEAVDRTDMSGNVKWAIRAKNLMYWNWTGNVSCVNNDFTAPECQFTIMWKGPFVSIVASNGKYLSVTSNGQLSATGADGEEKTAFVMEIVNNPILTLRGEYGFIGTKEPPKILECNRSQFQAFNLEGNAGTYRMKDGNDKYWATQGDNFVSCNAEKDKASDFFIELRAHSRMCIVAPNTKYLKGLQNGDFTTSGGEDVTSSNLWEY